jgi:NitT/TauT family transport system substrate-binding protein
MISSSGCKDSSTPHLVVGASVLRISLPVFLAEKQGIFKKHGLDVELRRYETAQPMIEEVIDGRIDAGGFVAYPIVFLAAKRADRPPSVVGALVEDSGHRLSYLLKKPGSPLRFPEDAAGKRFGILPTVAYRRWLEALLEASKVSTASVSILPIAPPLEAQSLSEGAVDFLFTNDPVATAALDAGAAEPADDGPLCPKLLGEPFAFGTFALSYALTAERPELAAKLAAAVDEAIEATRRDPEAAKAALAEALRPEERASVAHYPSSRYLTRAEAGPALLEQEIEREMRLKILSARPAVKSL